MTSTTFFRFTDALSDKDNPQYVYVNVDYIEYFEAHGGRYFEAHGGRGTNIYLSDFKRVLWVIETPEDLINQGILAIYHA